MPNELKPCPFCGGEAELHYQPLYTENGVCVRCIECNARSRFVLYDCKYQAYHGEKEVYVPKGRAINDVVNLWNRRADNA